MIHISFVVPGLAVGKQERATTRRRHDGTRYPLIYTERKSRLFMAEVAAQAELAVLESKLTGLPTDEALAVEIVSFFPRPKSAPPSQKWPIAKPDASNIQKAVEDSLHGVIFKNDSHVVSIKTDKRYCVNDMEPQTRVEIWTAGAKRYSELRPRREGGLR